MTAAHGDGSLGGEVHGDSLQAITRYFENRSCRHCLRPYTAEGIEFIRQEPGVVVVRVGCNACGQPLGIALVGMNAPEGQSTCLHGRPAGNSGSNQFKYQGEWTKKDLLRLSGKPPINYDDVLAAHEFLANVGNDWATHLPKPKQQSRKKID